MKLQTVQALRGFAALAVVLGHLRAIDAKHSGEDPVLASFWLNGASGVDLFFVISGFIMVWVAGQAPRGLGTASAFLFARASRIYPLWWIFAALFAAYFLYAYGVPYDPVHSTDGPAHLFKSFFLLPQDSFPVLGVGWTLVHEIYFYIAFAGLLLLPQRWLVPGLLAWLGTVIAGSMLGLTDGFASNVVELIFYPMTVEFILGACAARMIQKGFRPYPWLFLALGIFIFGANFVHYDFTTNWQALGWGRVLAFGLPAVLIVYGLVCMEVDGRQLAPKFMVSLGDWSYALYLGHTLVLSGAARIWFSKFNAPGSMDNIIFNVLAVAAAVIAAWISYQFIEKPMIRWFGKRRSQLFKTSNANLRPGPIEPRVW